MNSWCHICNNLFMALSMFLALYSIFKTSNSDIWKVNCDFSCEFRRNKCKFFFVYIGQKTLRGRGILLRRQFVGSVRTVNLPLRVSFHHCDKIHGKNNLKKERFFFFFGSWFQYIVTWALSPWACDKATSWWKGMIEQSHSPHGGEEAEREQERGQE